MSLRPGSKAAACCALLLGGLALGQTARVVLRWKATAGVRGYQVQISKETSFSQIVLDEKVQDPVLKWESLPATTFYWRVRSFDPDGRASEWSAPRQIAPATGAPTLREPADAAVLSCAVEPVSLSFELSPVLREYILELSPDGRFSAGDTTVLLSKTGAFSTPLPVGTVSWRGRGVDLTGRTTEPSAPRRLSVRLAPPRPKLTSDVAAGTASVSLQWTPSPCATRYAVEASQETQAKAELEAQAPSISFKPASVGEYRFRVAARDDKGNQSEWSAESTFRVRLPGPVGRAETQGAPGATGTPVELAWVAPPVPVAGYLVELAHTDAFKPPLSASAAVTGLSHKLVLPPGRYLWRVTAKDAAGHLSFPSEPRALTVAAAAPPPRVALMFPRDGDRLVRPLDGLLGVTWPKLPAAVSHELEVDGLVQAVALPPTRLALEEGDHTLRVRAVGVTGKTSDWSDEVHFYFGSARVVRAVVSFDNQPLRCDGASSTRVEVRLLDPRGRVVPGAKPTLQADRGELGPLTADSDRWVCQWRAPASYPADGVATLSVTEGTFTTQQRLRLEEGLSPLSAAVAVGGRFNFGAVRSPAAAVSLAWRPMQAGGWLATQVRAGLYGAAATVQGPDGPVGARVLSPSLSLLVGTHLDFGRWTLVAVAGGGVQLAAAAVGADSQTTALPAFEAAVAFGRRLGPGAVEVELSFLYSRLDTGLARLQAGGLFAGIGYRFDLPGGR